jgi:hypothetical protein
LPCRYPGCADVPRLRARADTGRLRHQQERQARTSRAPGVGTRQIRKEQLAIIDTNKDHRLSRDEIEAAKKSHWLEKLSPDSRALFKKLDTNNDGWLSEEEKGSRIGEWKQLKQLQREGKLPVSPTAPTPKNPSPQHQ